MHVVLAGGVCAVEVHQLVSCITAEGRKPFILHVCGVCGK